MTMAVSYLTIDGEIPSETRNGVESDYIPDQLGSTAALIHKPHDYGHIHLVSLRRAAEPRGFGPDAVRVHGHARLLHRPGRQPRPRGRQGLSAASDGLADKGSILAGAAGLPVCQRPTHHVS